MHLYVYQRSIAECVEAPQNKIHLQKAIMHEGAVVCHVAIMHWGGPLLPGDHVWGEVVCC